MKRMIRNSNQISFKQTVLKQGQRKTQTILLLRYRRKRLCYTITELHGHNVWVKVKYGNTRTPVNVKLITAKFTRHLFEPGLFCLFGSQRPSPRILFVLCRLLFWFARPDFLSAGGCLILTQSRKWLALTHLNISRSFLGSRYRYTHTPFYVIRLRNIQGTYEILIINFLFLFVCLFYLISNVHKLSFHPQSVI